jgi:hypothetical protein
MKNAGGLMAGFKTAGLAVLMMLLNIKCGMEQEYKLNGDENSLTIVRCLEFELDGTGSHPEWQKADWITLQKLPGGDLNYKSRFKVMYSEKGLYVLLDGEDQKISTDYTEDQSDMFNGDVFEVFLHPFKEFPIYFEYEINALGKELAILVPNIGGDFIGWQPWHYEEERRIKRAVTVHDGQQEPFASIAGWTVELFIPYAILKPLVQEGPKSGDAWYGNFYRLDYDEGVQEKWSWAPIERSFHEYEKYGKLVFE